MNLFTHIGKYLLMLKGMFSKPENPKLYWKEFMHQCSEIGVGSLGIVVIISFFMGAVSALQAVYQIVNPLISKTIIPQIVRDTVILEFAPTLICIVLAGVIGSKIASELGNMRVSEQIDALEIMGINSKTYLVMPKIGAAIVMIPMLVILSMVLGIAGGRITAVASGVVSAETYDRGLIELFLTYNVFFAMMKAYTFSFIISSVPAYFGYNVSGGSLEIGRSSTKSVVVSCVLILVADYILAQLLL
jgi:phospholipid/cholesterol/gamma-HCH transport system permease protein